MNNPSNPPRENHRAPRKQERGSALILAIFVMVMLMAVGMGILFRTQQDTTVASNYASSQKGLGAAESGLNEIRNRINVNDWETVSNFTNGGNELGLIVDFNGFYNTGAYANPNWMYFLSTDSDYSHTNMSDYAYVLSAPASRQTDGSLAGPGRTETINQVSTTPPSTIINEPSYSQGVYVACSGGYECWKSESTDAVKTLLNQYAEDGKNMIEYQGSIRHAKVSDLVNEYNMAVLEVQWDTSGAPGGNPSYGKIINLGAAVEIGPSNLTDDAVGALSGEDKGDQIVRVNYNRIRKNGTYGKTIAASGKTYYFYTAFSDAALIPMDAYEPFPVYYVTLWGRYAEGVAGRSREGVRDIHALVVPPAPRTADVPGPMIGYLNIDQTGLSSGYIAGVNVGAECGGPPVTPPQLTSGEVTQGNQNCDPACNP